MTKLIGEAVPAFLTAGIRIASMEEGLATAVLPLSEVTTNQHGTHQATIIALAADYTGGVALSTLFPELPFVGIHPITGSDSGLLWLASFDLKFRRPSCTDLHVSSVVAPEKRDELRRRFGAGEAQLVPLPLQFKDDEGELIAEGTFVYYLRHSAHLAPRGHKPAGAMFSHMAKSSARLIANLRAREQDLFVDSFSRAVAGQHGQLIGDRFLALLPELQDMVAGRTRHADDCLREALRTGTEQVVAVGTGLDCRPFRFHEEFPNARWFELDLPDMLAERERALAKCALPPVRRTPVPTNLLSDDLGERLSGLDGLDLTKPVFVLYEGCSMYFRGDDAARIFSQLSALVRRHPRSALWLDLVSARVATGASTEPSVRAFLENMARLGEPFVFGSDEPAALFAPLALRVERDDQADLQRPRPDNALFREYRFLLLRAA